MNIELEVEAFTELLMTQTPNSDQVQENSDRRRPVPLEQSDLRVLPGQVGRLAGQLVVNGVSSAAPPLSFSKSIDVYEKSGKMSNSIDCAELELLEYPVRIAFSSAEIVFLGKPARPPNERCRSTKSLTDDAESNLQTSGPTHWSYSPTRR